MQVDVKDLLHRCLTVCQEEIHALTLYAAVAQRLGKSLRNPKHTSAGILIQIGEKRSVAVWNHEQVPGIDRLNVHKRRADIILIDDTRR